MYLGTETKNIFKSGNIRAREDGFQRRNAMDANCWRKLMRLLQSQSECEPCDSTVGIDAKLELVIECTDTLNKEFSVKIMYKK